jgi:hypothetical protein
VNEITTAVRLELLAIGLVPTALVGLLGFMFREKWKQLLAKALAAQTEQIKLQAQRDIENYKVSLIAEVERTKALADRSKTLAIKHAPLEYEAITCLHGAIGEATAVTLARATSTLRKLSIEGVLKGSGPESILNLEPAMTACTTVQRFLKSRVGELVTIA